MVVVCAVRIVSCVYFGVRCCVVVCVMLWCGVVWYVVVVVVFVCV